MLAWSRPPTRSGSAVTHCPGPARCMVELAELLTEPGGPRRLGHVRQERDRRHQPVPGGGPCGNRAGRGGHGPRGLPRLGGVVQPPAHRHAAEDRANVHSYHLQRPRQRPRAVDAGGASNVAAVFVSPFRHDAGHDQELVDPAFARGCARSATETGAALVMDEVRAGLPAASRRQLGTARRAPRPERVEQGDCQRLPARRGPRAPTAFREAAGQIFATGSFWYSGRPDGRGRGDDHARCGIRDAIAAMERAGQRLRDGHRQAGRRAPGSTSCRPGRCRCPTSVPRRRELRQGHRVLRDRGRARGAACTRGTTGSCRPRIPTTTSTRPWPPPTTRSALCARSLALTRARTGNDEQATT